MSFLSAATTNPGNTSFPIPSGPAGRWHPVSHYNYIWSSEGYPAKKRQDRKYIVSHDTLAVHHRGIITPLGHSMSKRSFPNEDAKKLRDIFGGQSGIGNGYLCAHWNASLEQSVSHGNWEQIRGWTMMSSIASQSAPKHSQESLSLQSNSLLSS